MAMLMMRWPPMPESIEQEAEDKHRQSPTEVTSSDIRAIESTSSEVDQ